MVFEPLVTSSFSRLYNVNRPCEFLKLKTNSLIENKFTVTSLKIPQKLDMVWEGCKNIKLKKKLLELMPLVNFLNLDLDVNFYPAIKKWRHSLKWRLASLDI